MQRTRRDDAFTAIFLGFFAAAWFGWAQAAPPDWLVGWLTVGSVSSFVVLAAGVITAIRRRGEGSAMRDRSRSRRYGIIVGIEFALCGVGAAILGGAGQAEFIPVWIAVVVGIHFFPLVPVLLDRTLIPLGIGTCLVSLAALIAGLTTDTVAGTITGAGCGVLLLAAAINGLVHAVRPATS